MNFPAYCCSPAIALLLALFGAACDPCNNQILQEEATVDGTRKAVVFQRQCGTLGGTSTQVSVLPVARQPFAGGNIFGADTNGDDTLAMPSGGPPIAVKWLSEQELQIAYDARIRVFQAEKQLGDVVITYMTQDMEEPEPEDPSPKPKQNKVRRN